MGKITDLIDTSQFQAGLVDGVLALAIVLACSAIRVFGRRPPVAGAVFVGAGLAVLSGFGPGRGALDIGVLAPTGVVVLGAGGALSRFVPKPVRLALTPLLLLPGSVLLGVAIHRHGAPSWVAPVLVFAVPALGAFAGDFDRYHGRRSYGPALLVVSVAGVYVTVPDTEGARGLLGVAFPLIFLAFPKPMATLGASGAAAAVGLVCYVAAIEGAARPGSIVGAIGCVGMLAYEPIGRRILGTMRERDGHGPLDHWRNLFVAVAFQFAVVAWSARVAGMAHHAAKALVLLAPAAAAAIIASSQLPDPPLPSNHRPTR